MTTVAVVPAAGSGERLAADVPKAFVDLAGQTLIERALASLQASGVVDGIVVAVPPGRTDEAKLLLGSPSIPVTVIEGGRKLEMRGSVLYIGRTQTWVRAD